jgi:hypothetical protein
LNLIRERINGMKVISLNLKMAIATVMIATNQLGRNAISGPVDSAKVLNMR